MKSLCLWGFLITGLMTGTASAAEPAAKVQTSIATMGDIWVGQRIVISAKLLTPGFFASAAAFDLPQVDGLVIVPPAGSPVVGSEMIDDQSCTTQTHELAILPQRAGEYGIPPFPIRFDSTAAFGQPTHAERVTTSPLKFTAKLPPGAEGLSLILTTTRLKVTDAWQPEITDQPVPAGTAYTRTIQIEAENLPGMLLPSFHFGSPSGLRIYTHSPVVNDQSDRGTLTGRRAETSTIICERPGDYQLPAMALSWWNPVDQQLNRVELPGRSLTVISGPRSQTTSAESQKPRGTLSASLLAALLAVFTMIGLTGWKLAPVFVRHWKAYQHARKQSEPAYFHAVIQACRSGNAHDTYRALLAWKQRCKDVDNVTEKKFDEELPLMEEYRALESTLFGQPRDKSNGWSPTRLEVVLVAVRSHLRHQQRVASQWKRTALPAMNPTGIVLDD